ncbi:MAG: glycosyltransferase family 4 protein [Candidatus Lokiarchaeota archaeon]
MIEFIKKHIRTSHSRKSFLKVYFVFIGPPTMAFNRELSKIKEEIEAKIINFTPDNLSGYFDKIKLTAFKESEIYLMPSRSDAFGIAYLEAWASGKPVIGANIGATPEVIKTNIDGLLVEFDNPIDIAEKVLYLLKKKRVRKKLGKNGRKKVQTNYTWEVIAQKTHKMYQNLLKQKM